MQLTICDPACGSGAFLNQALDFLIKEHTYIDELKTKLLGGGLQFPDIENTILENNIYGVDLNEESVEIAKLSLWLRTAQPRRKLNDLSSNIKCGNSLIDDKKIAGDKAFKWETAFEKVFDKGGFDVIVGNPPYVVYIKSIFGQSTLDYINKNYTYSEYNPNTYALFTDLALNTLLKLDGYLGFIIPNSWLEGQYFSSMRKDVYNTLIEEIVYLKNSAFDEVVETVVIHIRNNNQSPKSIKLTTDVKENIYNTVNFDKNLFTKGYNPFIYSSNPLLKKLDIDFEKLNEHAIVYRGLETRNNKVWLSKEKKDENYLPILLGRDVGRYDIEYTGTYVNFIQSEMKSNANLDMYLQPKILMRRTGSTIIATKDEDNLMVLKNSYLIIPNEKYKLDQLLAQLNSSLFAFYHKSMTSAENKAFAQFKGTYILDFPVSFNVNIDFSNPVNKVIDLNANLTILKSNFKLYFSGQYNFLKVTRTLEYWYELNFTRFVKELNKAIKSTNKERAKENLNRIPELTKKDEFEWMVLFEENKKKAQELQSQIDKTEKEIDQMVYELYGLTEEEIDLIENN